MNDNSFIEVAIEEPKSKHIYERCNACNKDKQKVEIMASVKKHVQSEYGK